MDAARYLCSHLVRLVTDGGEQWVNLEEIWTTGAVLNCEQPAPLGVAVTFFAERALFAGLVTDVQQDELGWRVEMLFSPDNLWSPERWHPNHAVNPNDL